MNHEFQNCIGARLRSISRKVDAIYRKHLHDHNITESQLSILLALFKTGEIEQNEIGRILNLERSSLSRNLVRLKAQNLIEKNGAINRPTIVLTDKGLDFVNQVSPFWSNAMDEIHSLIGEHAIQGFEKFEQGFK